MQQVVAIQWDQEEPIDVCLFKPDEWETSIEEALSERPI